MNNEPVAYVSTTGLNDIEWTDASHSLNYGDALYTHPAELTDKEIYEVWFKYGCGMPWTANTKTFIRAILRKASEK